MARDGQQPQMRNDAMQIVSLLIGPTAFALNETIGYAITYHACSTLR